MAHMSPFSGSSEIIEIEEEVPNPVEQYKGVIYAKSEGKREDKDRRSVSSSMGHISSLEDDLNQLFEIFNRRASSQGFSHPHIAGPSRKNASKKPMRASGSFSPSHGISEKVNLKQALRGLCLSQASEMAALKRSAKAGGSSEAGRILTLYRNVVVEDSSVSDHSLDEGKAGMLEISLVPEETTLGSFQKMKGSVLVSDTQSSIPSSITEKQVKLIPRQTEMVFGSNERFIPTSTPEVLPKEKYESSISSSSSSSHTALTQSPMISTSAEVGTPTSMKEMAVKQKQTSLPAPLSPNDHVASTLNGTSAEAGPQASLTEKSLKQKHRYNPAPSSQTSCSNILEVAKCGMVDESPSHSSLLEPSRKEKQVSAQSSSSPSYGNHSHGLGKHVPTQVEMIPVSVKAGNQTPKIDDHATVSSSYFSDPNGNSCELDKRKPVAKKSITQESAARPGKAVEKGSIGKVGKKGNLHTGPSTSSAEGNKGSKSTKNAHRFVKPLIKTKNLVKKKSKKNINSVDNSYNARSEFNNGLYSGPNQIVCPRCHCVLNDDAWKEANQDSPESPSASISAGPVSENVNSDVCTPGSSSNTVIQTESAISQARVNPKPKDKGEFTQSSKSSPDEFSTSSSISEESNLSRPSFCDRPHMSKDVRWQAIRHVRMQQGIVGLRHFNLLKKLGCGDIGTVYLAELVGMSCLFAIKVMDNEFLVRRKKIARAQTEKEILRMLDHPFLPTLYCQFTSDNLSCLVMEYCPGGDLHVLRQRQPGRCFTEQAARFYVAEVLLALEYLHMLGVIYRDLKPENILVREDGHIMLSDFDLSLRCAVNPTLLVSPSTVDPTKRVSGPYADSGCVQPLCIEPSCRVTCFSPRLLASSSKPRKQKPDPATDMRPLLQLVAEPTSARSNSFVGTHEYLAPEIIKGEGHGSAVDWWTFGIFLYELLYGRTPFRGVGNEETLANVVLQTLKFPDSPLVSLQARDLIASLLVKEPENRLGFERGAAEVKQHPFFDGMNWALIRCAVPPELPEVRPHGIARAGPQDKGSKYVDYDPGSGETLEFEVF